MDLVHRAESPAHMEVDKPTETDDMVNNVSSPHLNEETTEIEGQAPHGLTNPNSSSAALVQANPDQPATSVDTRPGIFKNKDVPMEIMDLIFAPSAGLNASDYVAIAGTCKFFRERLDSTVFKSICHHTSLSSFPYTTNRSELHDHQSAFKIFTRDYINSYTPALRSGNYRIYNPSPRHYQPDGPREKWTRSQYEVHKEEQFKWIKQVRKENAARASKEASIAKKRRSETARWIRTGSTQTRVTPQMERPCSTDDLSQSSDQHKDQPETLSKSLISKKQKYSKCSDRVRKALQSPKWIVPSPEDETDIEEYLPVEWDRTTGQKIIHDFWPNEWRTTASRVILDDYITRTEVMKEYVVDDGQLMWLKHYCLPKSISKRTRKDVKTEYETYVHDRLKGLGRHQAKLEEENNTMRAKIRSNNGQLQACERIKGDLSANVRK
ncbi:hypothetical protein I302_103672 [Kwoniella bestiolae CBS 10118]|uniref:Uncharacterized protein n=1 Tax=Kwoniella bestiolae CBS 10118 TaxID=1296100 RepID=A0A1B9G914_9TREE|nr:hypothetical protein I302_02377 [Kwoniella bestiolae CBS 10118]OCF27535.1 hypothetical protein I302_02377 [Kwoniella bestiolae CBS 10118]